MSLQRQELVESALSKWKESTNRGTLAMCTGSGKSRIGILALEELDKLNEKSKFCLVVPTVKLRDTNWDNEFHKWNKSDLLKKVDKYCYASITKVKDKDYDMVILDEVHNLTERNSKFLEQNNIKAIMGLTATPPLDIEKRALLDKYCPVVFTLSLDEGVKMGIVAPYDVEVIETRLDDKEKNIRAGRKGKYYYVTEQKKYDTFGYIINKMRYADKDPMPILFQRMRFLYDLKSKTKVAKYLLDNVIPPEWRTLIFCGSIKQANELCKHRFHSKTDDKDLIKFSKEKINRLSCVKALNEGHNLPNVDAALIVQLNSKPKDLVQRVGRIVRYRDNHRAKIWILSTVGTQDEAWMEKALASFDNVNITFTNYKNIIRDGDTN